MRLPRPFLVLLLLITALVYAHRGHAQTDPSSRTDDATDVKEKARVHFIRGLEHFNRGAWEPALAEFLQSRALFATRGNSQNAAVALNKLGRYDEALDLFEELIAKFPDLPDRAQVESEIRDLARLVGAIEVKLAASGATVVIDGRPRGVTPLSKPLRVTAGSRSVRVVMDGMVPYETRVDVAGGVTVPVVPTLTALVRAGRLKVSERSGRSVEVLIDGIVVGTTPWEGALQPGTHTVILRGPGNLGTPPVLAPVRLDQATVLSLTVEPLDCTLEVTPEPLSASVAIDGVEVGRGSWAGRLRCGSHRVEVGAEGFVAVEQSIELLVDRPASITVRLARDPNSALWRAENPPRIFIEGIAAGAFIPSTGGDVFSGCTGDCTSSAPLGGAFSLRGGYQFSSGIGLGLELGYLWAQGRVTDRELSVETIPSNAPAPATATERVTLRGVMLGAGASLQRGKDWPWTVRLGGGVLLGSVDTFREATVALPGATDPPQYGPLTTRVQTAFAYVAPEFRLGRRVGSVELSLGVAPALLLPLSEPSFPNRPEGEATSAGFFRFPNESLTGSPLFMVQASVGLRYSFL